MSQLHWRLHDAEIDYKKDKTKIAQSISPHFMGTSAFIRASPKPMQKNTAEKNSTFSHELNCKKPAIFDG